MAKKIHAHSTHGIASGTPSTGEDAPLYSPEEEAFFISEALAFGAPNWRCQYDLSRDLCVYGDLFFDRFGWRAQSAGLDMGASINALGLDLMRAGGRLYERYKQWYALHQGRTARAAHHAARVTSEGDCKTLS